MTGGRTFDDILRAHRGAGPGFDLLRIGLAVSIMLSHCSAMAGNGHLTDQILDFLWQALGRTAAHAETVAQALAATVPGDEMGAGRPYTIARVPMFFALSGFLVTSSALRNRNVLRFLALRVLRIFPALVVEVVLSALLLGALFTTLPLRDYVASPVFHAYFLNVLGLVHMELPGVFRDTSPSTAVNGNLWTLPVELHCYLLMTGAMLVGLVRNRVSYLLAFVVASAILIVGNAGFGLLSDVDTISGPVVLYYFACGVLLYLWRDKVPYHPALAAAALALYVMLCFSHKAMFVYPLLLTYVTIFVGLTRLPRLPLLGTGDYSYGVYLYGFPITQAVIAALPAVRGNMAMISAISLVLTLLVAALSWHGVEKHMMKLKRFISPRSAALTGALHDDAAPAGGAAFGGRASLPATQG